MGSFIFVCIGVFGVCGVRKEGDDNVEVGKLGACEGVAEEEALMEEVLIGVFWPAEEI